MKRVDYASFSGSSGAAPSRRAVPEPRSLSPEADRWRNIPKAETYGHRMAQWREPLHVWAAHNHRNRKDGRSPYDKTRHEAAASIF